MLLLACVLIKRDPDTHLAGGRHGRRRKGRGGEKGACNYITGLSRLVKMHLWAGCDLQAIVLSCPVLAGQLLSSAGKLVSLTRMTGNQVIPMRAGGSHRLPYEMEKYLLEGGCNPYFGPPSRQ